MFYIKHTRSTIPVNSAIGPRAQARMLAIGGGHDRSVRTGRMAAVTERPHCRVSSRVDGQHGCCIPGVSPASGQAALLAP